jgi:hypothetical protein
MSCSGSTTCGMNDPKEFDAIGTVPLKYGSPGNYVRRTVRAEKQFYQQLVDWVQTLRFFSGTYGGRHIESLNWIGHVGAFVCKDGCHGRGRAIDINRIQWNGNATDMFGGDHTASDRTVRRRYIAVDAACRKHFKYTLDGWYNAQHTNHIHIDDHTAPILDRGSASDTGFVQAVCNNFNGAGLAVDGSWGPATQAAWRDLNQTWGYVGCDPFSSRGAYGDWLNFVMAHGFSDSTAAAAVYRSFLCS